MHQIQRYAVYYAPDPGELADFAAGWLGWDPVTGQQMPHPDVPGLLRPVAELTATPRKYGFHGTIKPPFHLATGTNGKALHVAAAALCARLAPVVLDGMELRRIGGFVGLTPKGDTTALASLAATVVADLDGFRALPSAAEIARRKPEQLTPRQRAHLAQWGYPYVMQDFLFHLTLTGDLNPKDATLTQMALAPLIEPLLQKPFVINSLCLFGQTLDERFHLIHRYALSG